MTGAGEWYPLSPLQRHLWRFTQREPDSAAYNLGLCLWLDGALDRNALAAALNGLLARHEMLRARFGDERQRIAPACPLPLDDDEVSGAADLAAEARHRARELLFQPYRFEDDANLFRCRLYRLASDRHMLALGTHHLAFDGWSLQLLIRDLETSYNGEPGAPARQRYVDHAVEQARWEQGDAAVAHRAFWREYLGRHQAPPALPMRQAIGSSRAAERYPLSVPG